MTLGEHLRAMAETIPDKTALILGDQALTYREFDEQTTGLALGLQAQGIGKGDRVALHMTNTIELALSYFGCFKAGAIAVPVNARLKPDEIAHILQHSGARIYIGEPGLFELGDAVRASCPDVEQYVSTTGEPAGRLRELLAAETDGPLPQVVDSDLAAILYTSGTTGSPKGVTHSHASLRECGRTTCQLGYRSDDVMPLFVPLTHASGLNCSLIPGVLLGITMALVRNFEPKAVLETIERHRGTLLLGLPPMLQMIFREQFAGGYDASSLRMCAGGGDTVPPALQEEVGRSFGVFVQELIGMTEALPTCLNRPGRVKTGSVGETANGVEVRLVDENGMDVKPGEVGEMIARHPGTMVGYWRNPEATAEAIRDGWLHTGDLARQDEDGYYWFAGRRKELIIRGGSNISPQQVEDVLLKHPAVFQAGVVGAPDPLWGETVVAFVRRHDDKAVTEDELVAFAKEHIADYKSPERIRFMDELPLGVTGKVSRKALRAML